MAKISKKEFYNQVEKLLEDMVEHKNINEYGLTNLLNINKDIDELIFKKTPMFYFEKIKLDKCKNSIKEYFGEMTMKDVYLGKFRPKEYTINLENFEVTNSSPNSRHDLEIPFAYEYILEGLEGKFNLNEKEPNLNDEKYSTKLKDLEVIIRLRGEDGFLDKFNKKMEFIREAYCYYNEEVNASMRSRIHEWDKFEKDNETLDNIIENVKQKEIENDDNEFDFDR